MRYKNFEDFLQDEFVDLREIGGIPITKDNCEDMFDNWFVDLTSEEMLKWGDLYGKSQFNEGKTYNMSDEMRMHTAVKKLSPCCQDEILEYNLETAYCKRCNNRIYDKESHLKKFRVVFESSLGGDWYERTDLEKSRLLEEFISQIK